jgi:hypothetical protein
MRTVSFASFLLFAAICISFLSMPKVDSQSTAVTTTTTIRQPPAGQCSEISIAFSGQAGKEVYGIFGSGASVNFYVLTAADFISIKNPTCSLPASSKPLYRELNVTGYDNYYRSIPFPTNGTYYFVFVLLKAHLPNGYTTVQLTFPASVLLSASTTLSSTTSPPTTPSMSQITRATMQTIGSTTTVTAAITNYSTVTVTSTSVSLSSLDIVLVPSIVALALVTFGAVRYSYRKQKEVSARTLGEEAVHRRADFDERVYAYIKSQGGTISLSSASLHFGVPVAEIKASIDRLKGEGRISF